MFDIEKKEFKKTKESTELIKQNVNKETQCLVRIVNKNVNKGKITKIYITLLCTKHCNKKYTLRLSLDKNNEPTGFKNDGFQMQIFGNYIQKLY